jgi:hypothetical protein
VLAVQRGFTDDVPLGEVGRYLARALKFAAAAAPQVRAKAVDLGARVCVPVTVPHSRVNACRWMCLGSGMLCLSVQVMG